MSKSSTIEQNPFQSPPKVLKIESRRVTFPLQVTRYTMYRIMLHQSVPCHPIMLHIRSHHMKWHHITSHQLICWQVIISLLLYQLTGWLAMQCDPHPQLYLTWALVWSHLIIPLLTSHHHFSYFTSLSFDSKWHYYLRHASLSVRLPHLFPSLYFTDHHCAALYYISLLIISLY